MVKKKIDEVDQNIKSAELTGLDALGKEADTLHEQIVEGMTTALAKAREIGQLLTHVAYNCARTWHSSYSDFVASRKFSARTARAYVRIYENWTEIQEKWQNVAAPNASLSINSALRLIAEKKEPDKNEQENTDVDPGVSKEEMKARRDYHDSAVGNEPTRKKFNALLAKSGLKGRLVAVLDVMFTLGIDKRAITLWLQREQKEERAKEEAEREGRGNRNPRVAGERVA